MDAKACSFLDTFHASHEERRLFRRFALTGLFRKAAAAVYNTLAINNSNSNRGFFPFYVDSEIVC